MISAEVTGVAPDTRDVLVGVVDLGAGIRGSWLGPRFARGVHLFVGEGNVDGV
jgi:hypothetical protein